MRSYKVKSTRNTEFTRNLSPRDDSKSPRNDRDRQGILTSRSSRAVGPSFPSSPSPTATQGWPPFSLSWPNASPSFGIDRVCKPASARRWRGLGSISLNLQASAGQLLCLGFDLRLHLGANENFPRRYRQQLLRRLPPCRQPVASLVVALGHLLLCCWCWCWCFNGGFLLCSWLGV